jgi:hypothetical protein
MALALLARGDVHGAGHDAGLRVDHDRAAGQEEVANSPVGKAEATFEIVDRLVAFKPGEQVVAGGRIDIGRACRRCRSRSS